MAWYVLRCKHNKEEVLCNEVQARGFEVFYPRIKVNPVNPRARTMRPYFPGYMFVSAEEQQVKTPALAWIPFSLGLISFDNKAAQVSESIVLALRRHLEEQNKIKGVPPIIAERGEKVTIQNGQFAGYRAIFDTHLSGTERVRVLISYLKNNKVTLELPASQIKSNKTH